LLYLFKFGVIKGTTRFEKLLFLQKNELRFVKGNFYGFKWYHYGPFSEDLLHDLRELKNRNLISVEVRSVNTSSNASTLYVYRLDSEGDKLIPRILKEMPSETMEILEKLRPFYIMSLEKLKEYVYKRFDTRRQ
jgi:uncharacterized protein YwgA